MDHPLGVIEQRVPNEKTLDIVCNSWALDREIQQGMQC